MAGYGGRGPLGSSINKPKNDAGTLPLHQNKPPGRQFQSASGRVDGIQVRSVKQPFVAAADADDIQSICEERVVSPSVRGEGRHMLHHTWGDADAKNAEADMPVCGGKQPVIRLPEVTITRDAAGVWEISKVEVFSAIFCRLSSPGAAPKVGENVTNNPSDDVRTPRDDPDGKGYWKKVAENLREYGKNNSALQWDLPGATKFHEQKHLEVDLEWLNSKWREMEPKAIKEVKAIIQQLLNDLQDPASVTPEVVSFSAKAKLWLLMEKEQPPVNEDYPYRKTREKFYLPEAAKIEAEAKTRGWR